MLGNLSRATKSSDDMYVQKWQLDGKPKATSVQIQTQAKMFPLKDFVYNVSIDWMKALEVERIAIAYSSDL